jgi:NADPH:quinone reductase-like Zn-dependent oxidoreductase
VKAAVLHRVGGIPRYEDFPDPVAREGEVIVEVEAVALENIDKAIAAGTHYAAKQFISDLPAIMGFDGVGMLSDGTLVGFANPRPPYGALAERTVVSTDAVIPVPEGIDPTVAVVLASAVTGFAMRSAAGFAPGETVLIQGATGVAGRLAVQVARLLGAGRIVATGRDNAALRDVLELGADAVINTAVADEELARAFATEAGEGYDVVLDFLWGRPTEVLMSAFVPRELTFAKPTRLVQIGESAGPTVMFSAESLRTSGLEIYGVGKGISQDTMADAYSQVLLWARAGKLVFSIEEVPLSEIATAWQRANLSGKRLVVVP